MLRMDGMLLCTVSELVEVLSGRINKRNPEESNFGCCDFLVPSCYVKVEEFDGKQTLREIASRDGGWYGIKAIDIGFDENGLTLCSNYYGGDTPAFRHIFGECSESEIREAIEYLIAAPLRYEFGAVNGSMLVIAELSAKVKVRKRKRGAA